MEKNIEVSMLCQYYGKLLTEKQYALLNDYYNNDYSLSEIAENYQITRQAVRDNLKKGEKKLFEIEESLGFMKRMLNQQKAIDHILAQLSKIQDQDSDKQVSKILEHVRKELNCLV